MLKIVDVELNTEVNDDTIAATITAIISPDTPKKIYKHLEKET